jgi:predicted PurR-regulated permease PerM
MRASESPVVTPPRVAVESVAESSDPVVSVDAPSPAGSPILPDHAVTSLRVLAACAVVYMLHFAAPVLLPIVLSLLLFYALDPLVEWLERGRIPRAFGSLAVVLGVIGLLAVGGALVWPQLESVVTKVPAGAAQLRATLRRQRSGEDDSALAKVQAAAKALDSAAAEAGRDTPPVPGVTRVEVQQPWRISGRIWAGGLGAISLMGQGIAVLFLTTVFLNAKDSFKRRLVRRMGTLGSKRVTVQILNDIESQIGQFLWVQALTSTFVAVVTGAMLWWLNVEEPAVWGIFAGLMNVVPYFGPLIVTVVLFTVSYLQFQTLDMAGLVAVIALAITTFEGMYLTPHLLSRAASLNHVAVFLAIAFWSWAWGVPGMLLAVPILMAAKAFCDHVEGLEGVGTFLGSE